MRRGNWKIRIIIGLLIIGFAYWKKCANTEINQFTGTKQSISISTEQEIAIGLQSAPGMTRKYGGELASPEAQALVKKVGQKLVASSVAKETPYKYDFHVLADQREINAFALPGGQVFITYALLSRLQTEDQLAGVLGHEIGHIVGRHSAERIANSEFWQSVVQGADVGAGAGQAVAGIANGTLLKNSRGDELESDALGVKFMMDAGYQPCDMIGLMKILKASNPNGPPEYKSDHPDPENRMQEIKLAIQENGGDASCSNQ